MDSFFDKINTLINAQLNEFLGRNPKSPLARIKLDTNNPDANPKRTVQSLRQRMNEALEYEDELAAKIQKLMQEAVTLDEEADRMVKSGDEFSARRAVSALQMKQQQVSIAESELRDHRLLTQHLMQEMTSLEMALDNQERNAQQSAAQTPPTEKSSSRFRIPVDGGDNIKDSENIRVNSREESSIKDTISDAINDTRSTLENLLKNSPVPKPADILERFDIVDEVPDPAKKDKKNSDDIEGRMARLSKPDDDE